MSSTFDTFKDLFGDVADDYKKALDDLLDRDEDDDSGKKKKRKDSSLSALANVPGLAGLPLGTVQALVDAGPAAPALASLIAGTTNPLAAAANPLAAVAGGAGANPLAALSGAAGANPLAALGGGAGGNPLAAANPLALLGGVAGAAGDAASLAETLLALPGQLAQLTDAITKLMNVLPGVTGSARKTG